MAENRRRWEGITRWREDKTVMQQECSTKWTGRNSIAWLNSRKTKRTWSFGRIDRKKDVSFSIHLRRRKRAVGKSFSSNFISQPFTNLSYVHGFGYKALRGEISARFVTRTDMRLNEHFSIWPDLQSVSSYQCLWLLIDSFQPIGCCREKSSAFHLFPIAHNVPDICAR